ncbi:GNAT family N-acetyltransferase [Salininema proteolyticum]|uniref:GNAT family N-acetyltransferase n=1 Tax=Salininema proteolyticum TaxID=1607685 RepID=A0ABV8U0Q9_9ACTN
MSDLPALHHAALAEMAGASLFSMMRLRQDVFVVEQDCAYPDMDDLDAEPETVHLWAEDGGDVVSCLRLYPYEDGWKIGRVCTAADHRGTGLSARLMAEAVALKDPAAMVLDSQTYAMGFYAKHGFEPVGEEFLEDGIPHRRMRRAPRS